MLEELIEHSYFQAKVLPDVLKCAKGLVVYKLAVSEFIMADFEACECYCELAIRVFDEISDVLKLRFINIIQNIYNMIGLVLGQRKSYE